MTEATSVFDIETAPIAERKSKTSKHDSNPNLPGILDAIRASYKQYQSGDKDNAGRSITVSRKGDLYDVVTLIRHAAKELAPEHIGVSLRIFWYDQDENETVVNDLGKVGDMTSATVRFHGQNRRGKAA